LAQAGSSFQQAVSWCPKMAYSGEQVWGEGLMEAERVDGADSGTELLQKTDQHGAGVHLTARRALKAGIAGLFLAALTFAAVTFNAVPEVSPSRSMVVTPDFDDNPQKLFQLNPDATYGPKKLQLRDFLKDKCTSLGYEFLGWFCYSPCGNLTGGKYPIRTSPVTCCQAEPCGVSNSLLDTHYKARVHLYKCKDGEERFGANCFKTCDSLTQHEFPYRTGTGSCCKTKGIRCMWPSNSKTSVDYSIGASNATCKDDEEIYMKHCFKKCSILTNGTKPYRSAASTCCKTTGWACISPFNADTDPHFTVGGGQAGDCPVGWEFSSRFCFKTCSSLTAGKFGNRVSPNACCSTTGLQCLLKGNLKVSSNFSKGSYFLSGGGKPADGANPDTPDVISSQDKTVTPSGAATGATGPMDRFR